VIHLRSAEEIEAIAQAGAIVGGLFDAVRELVVPGINTLKLDRFCEQYIVSHEGAVPAFKGLYGFPGSACISINEEVVHGIPSRRRVLKDGDIVSVDVGVRMGGWYTDSARTFPVGEVSREAGALLEVTRNALGAALSAAVPGNHVGDIGAAVEESLDGRPYGIIRDLVGHGIGRELHEEPQVPNVGRAGHGPALREGMVLAIEPMISAGTASIKTLDDGWTVVTADGSLAAHFEHTVAILADGPRVLTGSVGGAGV
jgi:methionyl aminopeptidase